MKIQIAAPEIRGGLEAAVQGFSTSIGPILIFLGLFGSNALPAAFHATLITATIVHVMHLLLRSHVSILPCARVASGAAYAALILQLAKATPDPNANGSFVSLYQFEQGLIAASALFLVASILVLLSGLFKLGNIFKMIPTPVTSGISSGTGILLVWLAAIQIDHSGQGYAGLIALFMLGVYLTWPTLQTHFSLFRHLPGALIAPALGVLLLWLFNNMGQPHSSMDASFSTDKIPVIQWFFSEHSIPLRLLSIGIPGCITLGLIMVLETFTAASAMEARFGVSVDANRELIALGGANIVSAAVGGVPSTGSPTRSFSNWLAGGRGLLASLTCIVTTAGMIWLLRDWLLELPAALTAGLFLMQSVLMFDSRLTTRLKEMFSKQRTQRDRGSDQAFWLSVVIALVAFFGSLIWASLMGIALSSLLVLRRLSDRLTARWDYLDRFRSRRVRTAAQDDFLQENRHAVAILRLSGHLFFGNSLRITQLSEEAHPDADIAVIDVAQVTDTDPSATDALTWLIRALLEKGKTVVMSGVEQTRSLEMRHVFSHFQGARQCTDLDRAIELAENYLLGKSGIELTDAFRSGSVNRLLANLDEQQLAIVYSVAEIKEIRGGEALFEKDTVADGVWLLEDGIVSILVGQGNGSRRLATFGPGQFLGEMGFIDGNPRSASAVAETDVRAMFISNQAFETLRTRLPDIVIQITINIARELSQRVRNTSALLADQSSEESERWNNSSLSLLSKR